MRARLIKIQASSSQKTGGVAYLLCFKGEDGKSYQSWVDSGYRNYQNWKHVMKDGAVLSNLNIKKANIIDADSRPVLIKEKTKNEESQLTVSDRRDGGTGNESPDSGAETGEHPSEPEQVGLNLWD